MRKSILITAAAMCVGVSVAVAQDSTRRQSQSQSQSQSQNPTSVQQQKDKTTTIPQSDRTQDQTGTRKSTEMGKGWTRVEDRDVPSSLRTTLGESKYKGWERTGVYKNESGDRYQVRIGEASPTTYYFDKEGKAVKER